MSCKEKSDENLKIDLVYTWVDNKDPKWLEKKSKYDKTLLNLNKDANDACRYFNNDELKYSLKSLICAIAFSIAQELYKGNFS